MYEKRYDSSAKWELVKQRGRAREKRYASANKKGACVATKRFPYYVSLEAEPR